MNSESRFISVGKIYVDKYKNSTRATTRRVIAYAELDRLTIENKAQKMKIKSNGYHTGLVSKGLIKRKKNKTVKKI